MGTNPTTSGPGGERLRPPDGLVRLIAHTASWAIEFHPGDYWTAERVDGSAIRYLAADNMDGLADAIDRAEQ